MQLAARIISWVFLPLFVPMYALLLTLYIPSNQDYYINHDCLYLLPKEFKWGLIYMFLIFSTIAPGASYIALYRTKMISTVEMDDRKERTFPILIMFFYCMALYGVFMVKVGSEIMPKFALALPLSGAVVTAVFAVLNRWRKVSIHTGTMGIATGYLIAYMVLHAEYAFWMLPAVILASGAVMSARVYLGKHTMLEIIVGWFTGTLITFAINYFY
jgi:hypothetical protein